MGTVIVCADMMGVPMLPVEETEIYPSLEGLVWGKVQPGGMVRLIAPPFIEPVAVKVNLNLLFLLSAKTESGITPTLPEPSVADTEVGAGVGAGVAAGAGVGTGAETVTVG